ncbi:hypothetical protein AAMO2058_000557800 [Amorphochlora amoebiformis]
MSSEEVKKLNSQAKTAIESKDFNLAIDLYTSALEKEGVEGKNYHKLLANRSIAYQRMGRYSLALKDAEASIALNEDFFKAHERKGDALWQLSRLPEAKLAYAKAKACPRVSSAKIAELERKIKSCDENESQGEAESGEAKNADAPPTRQGGLKPKILLKFALDITVLICAVMYLVDARFYYWSVRAGIASNLLLVYAGMSKSTEFRNLTLSFSGIWTALKGWFPREFIQKQNVMLLFPYFVLLISKPLILGVAPLIIRTLVFLPGLLTKLPSLVSAPFAVISNYIKPKTLQLEELATNIEIMFGFMLILLTVTGFGSVVTVLMYWQYLRMSYMIARHPYAASRPWALRVQSQWDKMSLKIDGVVNSYVPASMRRYYFMAKGALSRMTDPQQQAQGGGVASMLGGCTIS